MSLDVAAGEFAGLIGRNGAGKTTLLRTIMGLLRPAAGTLDSLDRDARGACRPTAAPRSASATCRRTGGWFRRSRRRRTSCCRPGPATRTDAPAQLARIYETIPELTALRARKALQLSGGQQKLVALGRALMAGRKLLLLDEPFEGVAPVLARRLAEVIAGLRQSGLSVILSESSMTHAHGLLDRVFTIDRGAVSVRS